MVEDAVAHPLLPFVMWLTLACSSASPIPISRIHIETCLGITFEIASILIRFVYTLLFELKTSRDPFPRIPESLSFQHEHLNSCSALEIAIVKVSLCHCMQFLILLKSLLARSAFGGMTGDIVMLKGFAILWTERFCGNVPTPQRYNVTRFSIFCKLY